MFLLAPFSLDDLGSLINCLGSLNISCQLQFRISCYLAHSAARLASDTQLYWVMISCSLSPCVMKISIVSALITLCDGECNFVWSPSFMSNVLWLVIWFHKEFRCQLFHSLGSFHNTCFINCKSIFYSMVVFDSITCQTVVSDPSFGVQIQVTLPLRRSARRL